jgi:nicotinic acid mononucleotide adenylyltransferase
MMEITPDGNSFLVTETRRRRRRRRIALFGLSANPITDRGGHGDLIKHLISNTKLSSSSSSIDEVWIVPVFRHAYEQKNRTMKLVTNNIEKVPDFNERLEMCEIQFNEEEEEEEEDMNKIPVKVKRIELEATEWKRKQTGDDNAQVIGTFELLEYLRKNLEETTTTTTEYTLVLGRDAYDDLVNGKWIRGDEILETTNIIVVPRITTDDDKNVHDNNDNNNNNNDTDNAKYDDSNEQKDAEEESCKLSSSAAVIFLSSADVPGLRNVSSTTVRELIKNGMKPSAIEELNPKVARYIEENSFYV